MPSVDSNFKALTAIREKIAELTTANEIAKNVLQDERQRETYYENLAKSQQLEIKNAQQINQLNAEASKLRASIYALADRAIKPGGGDFAVLRDCWHIANIAYQVALEDFKIALKQKAPNVKQLAGTVSKYRAGERKIFKELLDALPGDMQLLKVLYVLGERGQVDEFLTKFFDPTRTTSDEALIKAVIKAVQTACGTRAVNELFAHPNFNSLENQVKAELVAQRESVIKWRAFLSFREVSLHDPLSKQLYEYSKEVEKNIKNALLNYQGSIHEKEFARISDEIQEKEAVLRKAKYDERKAQLGEYTQSAESVRDLGNRFGQSGYWGYAATTAMAGSLLAIGSGPLLSGAVGAIGIAAQKIAPNVAAKADNITQNAATLIDMAATLESDYLMESPQAIEQLALLEKIGPTDFEFILQIDKNWGEFTAVPFSLQHVAHSTKDLVDKKKEEFRKTADAILAKPAQQARMYIIFNTLALLTLLLLNISLFTILLIGAAGVFVYMVWKLHVPGEPISNTLLRVAATPSYAIEKALRFVTRPFRALISNIERKNILRSSIALVGAVILGTLGALMFPLAATLALGAEIAAILMGATVGAYLGLGIGAMFNAIVLAPFNAANNVDLVSQEIAFSSDETNNLHILDPELDQKLVEHFNFRIDALKQKLATANILNPKEVVQEIKVDMANIKRDVEMIKYLVDVNDVDKLIKYLDEYTKERYYLDRQQFIDLAQARNQVLSGYTEPKRGFMSFMYKDKHAKEAKAVLGAVPDLKVKYIKRDYEAERAQLQVLADLHDITKRVRAARFGPA